MKYSLLGETDIEVSNYCLGTMTFGEQTNEEDAHLQMDKAFDAGINFLTPQKCTLLVQLAKKQQEN